MKATKFFLLLLIVLVSSIKLTSCRCKAYEYSILLEFEDFDFSTMDSVMLIRTNRHNINQHLDTLFFDLTVPHSFPVYIADNRPNPNFIIKNISPAFEHRITEISVFNYEKVFKCKRAEINFKFDSSEYQGWSSILIEP